MHVLFLNKCLLGWVKGRFSQGQIKGRYSPQMLNILIFLCSISASLISSLNDKLIIKLLEEEQYYNVIILSEDFSK